MAYQKVYMNQIYSSSLIGQLALMWRKNLLCDAVIKTGNISTKAHRLVMIAACPMLQHMENAALGSHLEVRLSSDISQESINTFLQYLYEGFMKLTEKNYKEVQKIAKLLQVDSVTKCCHDFSKCLQQNFNSHPGLIDFDIRDQTELPFVKATDLEKTFSGNASIPSDEWSRGSSSKRPRRHADDIDTFGYDYHYGKSVDNNSSRTSQDTIEILDDCVEVINNDPAEKDHDGWPVPSSQPPIQRGMGVSITSQTGFKPDVRVINISSTNVQPPSLTHQMSPISSHQNKTAITDNATKQHLRTRKSSAEVQWTATTGPSIPVTPPDMSTNQQRSYIMTTPTSTIQERPFIFPTSVSASQDKPYAAGNPSQIMTIPHMEPSAATVTSPMPVDNSSVRQRDSPGLTDFVIEKVSDSIQPEVEKEFQDSELSILKVEHVGNTEEFDLSVEDQDGRVMDQDGSVENQNVYIQQISQGEIEESQADSFSSEASNMGNSSMELSAQASGQVLDVIENRKKEDPIVAKANSFPIQCHYGLCMKMFKTEEQFKSHLDSEQNHGFANACVKCGKFFKSVEGYKIHYKTKHTNEKGNFKCNVCGKHFLTPTYLNQHSVSHTQDRPYVCAVCGHAYKRNADLKQHWKICVQSKSKLKRKTE